MRDALPFILAISSAVLGCEGPAPPLGPGLKALLVSKTPRPTLSAEAAETDLAALSRSLDAPYVRHCRELGPHRVSGKSIITVTEGDTQISHLETTIQVFCDKTGSIHATSKNDRDYGREVIFDGTSMYLRPLVGKYHARLPNNPGEPMSIADDIVSAPRAHFQLLLAGAQVGGSSPTSVAGRRTVAITLANTGSPRTSRPPLGPPISPDLPPALAQRKWRKTAKVGHVSGTINVDSETGLAISTTLEGMLEFTRDDRNFVMKVSVEQSIVDVGTESTVAAPAAESTISAPQVSPESAEREQLLRGIAEPAR